MKKTIAKVIALTTMASVQAAWASEQTVGTTNVVVDVPSRAVIVSCQMRPTDPTIMDVVYRVESAAENVKVRALAFEDGKRDFAHVLRPETFVDGTVTNLGDEVAANVEHTLSWKVTADWDEDIGNVSFEVLAMANTTNSFVLPYMYRDEVRTGKREYYIFSPKLKITRHGSQPGDSSDSAMDRIRRDVLFWFYANNDPELFLGDGILYWAPSSGDASLPLCKGSLTDFFSAGYDYRLYVWENYIRIYYDWDVDRYYYFNGYSNEKIYDFSLLEGMFEGMSGNGGPDGVRFPLKDVLSYCIPGDHDYWQFSFRKTFNAFLKERFSKFLDVEWEFHPSCIDER